MNHLISQAKYSDNISPMQKRKYQRNKPIRFQGKTCNRGQAREKAHQPITICVGFASDWLNKSMPILIALWKGSWTNFINE